MPPLAPVHLRVALAEDLPALPVIELAAGAVFDKVGMGVVADDPVPSEDDLLPHVEAGRVWVATIDHSVVAYALAVTLDGHAHLEQVSVDPEHAGRRIGAALVEEVDRWAQARGDDVLTLTTFADVPWNAPYYYRLGFRPIDTLGPELAAALDHEKRRFPGFARLAMARPVRGPVRR